MITQSVVANQNERFETPNGYGINMNSVVKATKVIGLIRNLKINLTGPDYKILVMVLNMENGVEANSMLLGRPWLKLAKAHHNWGESTLIITSRERNVMLSTIK
jgi:hypothetical protein